MNKNASLNRQGTALEGLKPGSRRPDAWSSPGYKGFVSDEERLFEVFHENTKMDLVMEGEIGVKFGELFRNPMLNKMMTQSYNKRNSGLPLVELPLPQQLKRGYSSVIGSRRTARVFSGKAVSLQQLAAILHHTYGMSGEAEVVGGGVQKLCVIPSGGALYPLELYVVASAVDGLRRHGVYHYVPSLHILEDLQRDIPGDVLGSVLNGVFPETVHPSAATFILTSVFVRMTYKYGDRGYRFVLAESGSACSQICFTATALGLGSCWVGGFYDDKVHELIDINGCDEAALSLVLVGTL